MSLRAVARLYRFDMKPSHVAARLATAILLISLAGCTAPAPSETGAESATPSPTPTPTSTPDTVVTELVMWGDQIVSQNAAGDAVGSVALGGSDAEPIISFLSAALGAEPVQEEVLDTPETCRPGNYASWVGSGADGRGVSVYAGMDQDGSPAPVQVKFQGPDTNGIALAAGFGAKIGDDVSAYLASDAVLVVQGMTVTAADIASGKTLLLEGPGSFIFDVVPGFSSDYPVGVASYVVDANVLNGTIAPGSWSAGYC